MPPRRGTPDTLSELDYVPVKQKGRPESPLLKAKRMGRPPKRYLPESGSPTPSLSTEGSIGQESLLTQETDYAADSQDILVETDVTNRPLAELLRTSSRLKQSEMVVPSHSVSFILN